MNSRGVSGVRKLLFENCGKHTAEFDNVISRFFMYICEHHRRKRKSLS